MRKKWTISVKEYGGVNRKVGSTMLAPGLAQVSENFDYRRKGAARVRAGYARLLAGLKTFTEVATDAFTHSNQALEDVAAWTGRGTNSSLIRVSSNTVSANGACDAGCEYNASTFDSDQYAELKVETLAGGVDVDPSGPMVRSTSVGAYALAVIAQDGSAMSIKKLVWTGVHTTLGVYRPGQTILFADDIIRIRISGTKIEGLINGVVVLTVFDSTYTTGLPGVHMNQLGAGSAPSDMDDFASGDLVAPVVKVTAQPTRLFAFERDDDQAKILVAYGGSVDEFNVGDAEWAS